MAHSSVLRSSLAEAVLGCVWQGANNKEILPTNWRGWGHREMSWLCEASPNPALSIAYRFHWSHAHVTLAGVALSLAVWVEGWLSNLSRFWWKQLTKQHVTCSSVSGYHCYLVESELGVSLVGCSFRSANFLPSWCLQSVSAWCNWIGCYFRLVILAFAGRLDWTWYYCFSKNIFGLKTEGQQFTNVELEASSVVCLMPLGQQHCSPD